MDRAVADEAARREWEEGRKGEWGNGPSRHAGRTSYERTDRSVASPVLKVLTSATFIRGVFGILKKVM
jgi:hypothetical protein